MGEESADVIPISAKRPLRHAEWETYALERAKGLTSVEAMRVVRGIAEGDPVPQTHKDWQRDPEVRARIEYLRQQITNRRLAQVSINEFSVLGDLDRIFEEAMRDGKLAQAAKVAELRGRYLGMWDGRRATNDEELEGMSDEKLKALVEEGQKFLERSESQGTSEGGSGSGGVEDSEAADVPPVSEAG